MIIKNNWIYILFIDDFNYVCNAYFENVEDLNDASYLMSGNRILRRFCLN